MVCADIDVPCLPLRAGNKPNVDIAIPHLFSVAWTKIHMPGVSYYYLGERVFFCLRLTGQRIAGELPLSQMAPPTLAGIADLFYS